MPAPKKSPTSRKQKGLQQQAVSNLPTLSTSAQPLLLRDDQQKITAGIKLEIMQVDNNQLRLSGWTLGSQRLALLVDNEYIPAEIKHLPRDDVLQTLSTTCDFNPGFELTVPLPKSRTLVLRWLLTINNTAHPIDFALDITAATRPAPAQELPPQSPQNSRHPAGTRAALAAGDIECAFQFGNGLLLLGWLDDKQFSTTKLHLYRSEADVDTVALHGDEHSQVFRVPRPDILELLDIPKDPLPTLGFVAWVPFQVQGVETIRVGFRKSFAKATPLALLACTDHSPVLEQVLKSHGLPLAELADSLRDEEWLCWLESRGYSLQEPADGRLGAVNQAFVIGGSALLLHGWIAASSSNIETLILQRADSKHPLNLAPRLQRLYRPDLFAAHPALTGELLGFIALIDATELVTLDSLQLVLRTSEGRGVITVKPESANVADLCKLVGSNPVLIEPVTHLVQSHQALQAIPGFERRFTQFLQHYFRARNAVQPAHVNDPNTLVATLDKVFNLGDAGLLLFGWYVATERKLVSITLHGPEGLLADITGSLFPLLRQDVAAALPAKYPGTNDYCGFCCHIPVATKYRDVRSLKFLLEDNVAIWLRVDCSKPDKEYLELAQEWVTHIPHLNKIGRSLFNLYQTALGVPLTTLMQRKRAAAKPYNHYAIGAQPAKPAVSLIMACSDSVSLRQFCGHIAKDHDIKRTELILVCTSSNEIAATAHYCCNLFDLSAVVLTCTTPLDIVEACNAGAALAAAPLLMFVDEGMIPCNDTLIGTLKSRLDSQKTLAAVGAHGLLFDGFPHNFGMVAKESAELPGFVWARPRHAKPRTTGASGMVPTDLLVSPCRAVRRSSFIEASGLDVRFVNSEFAWQALSVRLTESGKTLAIDTDATVWQRNTALPPTGSVRTLKDLLYYFDAWLATATRSKNINPQLGI